MNEPKLPIIAFSVHPWDEPQWMNRQQLLSRLAKRGWPVYYCTGALDWWSRGGDSWKSAGWKLKSYMLDGVTIVEAGKLNPTWQGSKQLSNWSLKRYCEGIKKIAGIEDDNFIGLFFHPDFKPYIDQLTPKYTHLHVYDLYWKQGEWMPAQQENLLASLNDSSLVTASSSHLVEELQGYTSRTINLLENAADVLQFSGNYSCPDDLGSVPIPRIGSIGTVNNKMDLKLVYEVASAYPQWHWVFVGRLEREELVNNAYNRDAFLGLEQLSNVHFLGLKHRNTVPNYMKHMNVLTMAYRTSTDVWAYVAFPLRLVEYLATGIPIVSCPLKVIEEHFQGLISVAHKPDQWVEKIKFALKDESIDNVSNRKSVAECHSWDNRVEQLEKNYLDMLNKT